EPSKENRNQSPTVPGFLKGLVGKFNSTGNGRSGQRPERRQPRSREGRGQGPSGHRDSDMSTPRIPVVGNIVGHRKTAAALTTPTTTISNSISTTPASKDVVDTEGPDRKNNGTLSVGKSRQGNVDVPKERCDDFRRCTDPLYSNVNIHRVQAGDNLGLANICGLLYKNGGGRYATLGDAECRESERGAIRRDIDSSLTKTLETPSQDNADSWNKLKHCLAGQDGDKGRYVSKVCSEAFHLDRLKTASTNGTKAGFLCDDAKVDRVAETFFNRKLEQLHCACANTTSATSGTSGTTIQPPHSGVSGTLQSTDTVCPQNVSLKIGLGFGFGFLVVLTFVVVVLFRRQRTLKRRLRQEQMRVSHLLSATDDTAGFYSEIDDFTQILNGDQREGNKAYRPLSTGYSYNTRTEETSPTLTRPDAENHRPVQENRDKRPQGSGFTGSGYLPMGQSNGLYHHI
ncbi:hypothetical protein BaRGS_00006693, partial [Batillaria attramentaria]